MATILPREAKEAGHLQGRRILLKQLQKSNRSYRCIAMILNGFGKAVNAPKLQWLHLKCVKN